jgi:tRNA uridine 5-carboxymethylaminomethyl modification enzyme
MTRYDVVVIGGGHAGAEAASAATRAGARTLLLTQNLETIGQMSCNPAIGGIAKGTVVREVDALGGIMGRATDLAMIQFRMLNRSKGPAVWSPRAQCDRGLYRRAVRMLLERHEGLEFAQGTVVAIKVRSGRVQSVKTREGQEFRAGAVVVTAGTFLRGKIHLGTDTQIPAGRAGDAPAVELSEVIADQGITIERFKTGTPPRVDGRSIDLGKFQRQDGDPELYWFSFHERAVRLPQVPCYLGWAGPEVRRVVEQSLSESALYGGAISGRGPRYCPSIEDKIVKFGGVERHQLFLEPEGLETQEMYVNGLSTSLPPGVQLKMLRAVPGLEQVRMTRPGYAIEYDYLPPTQLLPTLQVRTVAGLYFAGQVNGTTGYEEAAGQGVMAGLNAASASLGADPVVLRRDEAMIGVLIDDLVTRGVDEPYRLFTSRAEYRLLLRQDNALRRLLPVSSRLGLLTATELRRAESRLIDEESIRRMAEETSVRPNAANELLHRTGTQPITEPTRLAELVRRPGVRLSDLLCCIGWDGDEAQAEWADIELKYEGYLLRERDSADRLALMDDFSLPTDLPYRRLGSLSTEARQKLAAVLPESLGRAARIPGVSPSDLQNLVLEVLKWRRNQEECLGAPAP